MGTKEQLLSGVEGDEVTNGPATVASMSYADSFISADQCLVSVPKIWYLTGGSTKTGTITRLRLFNPFADNAEVTIATAATMRTIGRFSAHHTARSYGETAQRAKTTR